MRGLASADTVTGKVQRALTDEWQTEGKVAYRVGFPQYRNVGPCLRRLVDEGRAESRFVQDHRYMSGGYTEYRRKQ